MPRSGNLRLAPSKSAAPETESERLAPSCFCLRHKKRENVTTLCHMHDREMSFFHKNSVPGHWLSMRQ